MTTTLSSHPATALLASGIYGMHLSMCSHKCTVCGTTAGPWHTIYDHREAGQIHACNDCRREFEAVYFAAKS